MIHNGPAGPTLDPSSRYFKDPAAINQPIDNNTDRTLFIDEAQRIMRIHNARNIMATELQMLPKFIQREVLEDIFRELKFISE